MSIWFSPHPKAFLREICQSIATEKEHCVVSMPRHLLSSFREELISYGQKSLGKCHVLQLDPQGSLIQNLQPLFTLGGEEEVPVSVLPEATLRHYRTLVLFLPETMLPWEEEFFSFVGLMASHAKKCKDTGEHMLWSMLIVIPAGGRMPHEDIGLKLFHWWGRLHVSDVEYAIERNFGVYEMQERHLYCWFYALCKGLASSAPELVDLFWETLPHDMVSLTNALAQHELNTEENGTLVKNYRNSPACRVTRDRFPQGPAAELWHRGILDIDCHGRPSLHPAALVAAHEIDTLERLAVQGQMQVFLPLTLEVHSSLYRKAEDLLGKDWDTSNRADFPALNSEIGPLSCYLYTYYRTKLPESLLHVAKLWYELRNCIAHANLIPFEMAVSAVGEYQSFLNEKYK